jgi:hypothetical protein
MRPHSTEPTRRCEVGPSSYFMKSPPVQFTDGEARARTLRFIDGEPDLARR